MTASRPNSKKMDEPMAGSRIKEAFRWDKHAVYFPALVSETAGLHSAPPMNQAQNAWGGGRHRYVQPS